MQINLYLNQNSKGFKILVDLKIENVLFERKKLFIYPQNNCLT
jgi:hypothetical protein